MIDANHAVFQDIATLKKAIADNLAIARPTAFNKMQLDELRYFLAVYEQELDRLIKEKPATEGWTLANSIEGRALYERHDRFSDKNRGL